MNQPLEIAHQQDAQPLPPFPLGDSASHLALLCEQIQAISERLIETDSYTGWSEEDVLRVMRREGHALSVFHHHLQDMLSSHLTQA